jgi:hypothetical protein
MASARPGESCEASLTPPLLLPLLLLPEPLLLPLLPPLLLLAVPSPEPESVPEKALVELPAAHPWMTRARAEAKLERARRRRVWRTVAQRYDARVLRPLAAVPET